MAQLFISPLDSIDDILSWTPNSIALSKFPISTSKRILRESFSLNPSLTHGHKLISIEDASALSKFSVTSHFSSGSASFSFV